MIRYLAGWYLYMCMCIKKTSSCTIFAELKVKSHKKCSACISYRKEISPEWKVSKYWILILLAIYRYLNGWLWPVRRWWIPSWWWWSSPACCPCPWPGSAGSPRLRGYDPAGPTPPNRPTQRENNAECFVWRLRVPFSGSDSTLVDTTKSKSVKLS